MIKVDGYAWIDKAALTPAQLFNLRQALTVQPTSTSEFDNGPPSPVLLYAETGTSFGIPRGFYDQNRKKSIALDIAVSDGAPMQAACGPKMFVGATSGNDRFNEQSAVVKLFVDRFKSKPYDGAILQAGCAFGKTVTSLRIAMELGRRTLVLVNKEFFLKQWKDRAEEFFPGIRVGIVRQNKCEWKGFDVTVALVQSLAAREYDPDFYSGFGLIITDEVHRIGAPTWSPLIPRFNARYRLGLSATPRRKDGAERVFLDHIGPVAYVAKTQGSDFKVSRMDIPFDLKEIRRGKFVVAPHALNSAQIETQIAEDDVTTASIASSIITALMEGRKCFVVSTRTEQLWLIEQTLRKYFAKHPHRAATIGWVTGSVFVTEGGERVKTTKKVGGRTTVEWKMRRPTQDELDYADTCQVMLATKQMIEEGYDNQAIDMVILAMPMSDVEQTVGRGRRPCEPRPDKCARLCPWRAGSCQGKPVPVIKDVVHTGVGRLERKWDRRMAFYKAEGAKLS
jgi:hypothetical protein